MFEVCDCHVCSPRSEALTRCEVALQRIREEVGRAIAKYPPFNSAHEGYSVLAEEVDELWDHVKVKQGQRDVPAMIKEATQVAAMAIRFIVDMEDRGQR